MASSPACSKVSMVRGRGGGSRETRKSILVTAQERTLSSSCVQYERDPGIVEATQQLEVGLTVKFGFGAIFAMRAGAGAGAGEAKAEAKVF